MDQCAVLTVGTDRHRRPLPLGGGVGPLRARRRRRGTDHHVGVALEVWLSHDVGDVVTEEHPLVAVD